MRSRRFRGWPLLLALLSWPSTARPEFQTAASAAPIVLGESATALTGPWKFAPGDSPRVGQTLLWAQPGFDESQWTDMDLNSNGSINPAYGTGGFVTGWASRGFPALTHYAWYRLRLRIAPGSPPLWLKMPAHVDDAYQVYANGQYLGEFGIFTPSGVTDYTARPLSFLLPPAAKDGEMVLAVRFYMSPLSAVGGNTADAGGMHEAPVLGLATTVGFLQRMEMRSVVELSAGSIFLDLLALIGAAGALWVWLLNRGERAYLWLAIALIFQTLAEPIGLIDRLIFLLPETPEVFLLAGVPILQFCCWTMFWWYWFRLGQAQDGAQGQTQGRQKGRAQGQAPGSRNWIIPAVWIVGVLNLAIFALYSGAAYFAFIPAGPMWVLTGVGRAALTTLLVVVCIEGARRDRLEALLALPTILLLGVSAFSHELLRGFRIRTSWFPFGVYVGVDTVASTLMILVIGALVVRRFVAGRVGERLAKQADDQELEQARELQQHVLVPGPIASSSFAVETEYRPAHRVGGDFFQVIDAPDGSLLVVLGDVSGKGLSAAMLVAVLVGAVRTRADLDFDPAAILNTLNMRLMGRSGGHFATCIAVELRPDNTMRVANAGHLPPYRNGVELGISGSLPLGIVAHAEYRNETVQLGPGDRLTFMTDGVVEARNASGALFGFDETQRISGRSAAAIAQAAADFGQDDDITVVSVTLVGDQASIPA